MWLIDHSEGEGVGGGYAPSHAAYSAETYCLILFLTVRFTLWTNKGNTIISATGTALLGGNFSWVGKIPGPPPPPPPLYEALKLTSLYCVFAFFP